MTRYGTLLGTFLFGLLCLALATIARDADGSLATPRERPGPSPVLAESPEAGAMVVGTFDSRGVAAAYFRSERFAARLDGIREAIEAARTEGDEERIRELEAEPHALQKQAHEQVFGNAPIPDLLELLRDDLAGIAERAGVDVIVSQWDIVYHEPSAEFVDVTALLAEPFRPDEATRKVIADLAGVEPVPLDQLDHDHEHE